MLKSFLLLKTSEPVTLQQHRRRPDLPLPTTSTLQSPLMLRRWMIRSLTLTLVLCFLTAWVASYWITAVLVHYVPMGGGIGQNGLIAIRTGQISFLREGPLLSTNWQGGLTSNTVTRWWVPQFLDYYFANSDFRFLRFHFYHGSKNQFVSIPFWFLTILAGLLLWWAWRNTRGKSATGAFPVETCSRITATSPTPKP